MCLLPASLTLFLSVRVNRTVDNNPDLGGFLPLSYTSRVFKMSYAVQYFLVSGTVKIVGPDNYGLGGATLYTKSGPLYRTKIVNWQTFHNNSASNPNPQPNPDPCVVDPFAGLCL